MVPQWDRPVNARLIEAFESLLFGPERYLEIVVSGEPDTCGPAKTSHQIKRSTGT
jgi:hypothetical protein